MRWGVATSFTEREISDTLFSGFAKANWLISDGNPIPNRSKTTRGNTDARTSPRAFYESTHNRQMDIHEMWGIESFSDLMAHLGNAGELKYEEGAKEAITEIGIVNHREARRKQFGR